MAPGASRAWDVVVVGLGGIGSAALHHAARQGVRALGLERFTPGHDRGSSHGASRILRLAYFEHPDYVPLAQRSLDLWRALEQEVGTRIFTRTGGIDGGMAEGRIFVGALSACEQHGLAHEVLDGAALRARFPVLRTPRDLRFVLQPDAGVLDPEGGVRAHLQAAEANGAEVRTGVQVRGWSLTDSGVRIEVGDGHAPVHARELIVTAGPWSDVLLDAGTEGIGLDEAAALALAPPLAVERQVVAWFDPHDPLAFSADRLPLFNLEIGGGHWYGMPALSGRGPKLGRFGHLNQRVTPDTVSREVTRADVELLQGWADHHLIGAGGVSATGVCLFTHTRDGHFVVDRIPGLPVTVGCGFSGHGYKFAPAIGEGLVRLALGGGRPPAMSAFRWGRVGLFGDTPTA